MPYCVVNKCTNNSNQHKKSQGITYHLFPTKGKAKTRWVAAIRKAQNDPEWLPSRHQVVCSAHFEDDDLYTTDKGLRRVTKFGYPKKNLADLPGSISVADSELPDLSLERKTERRSTVVNNKDLKSTSGPITSQTNKVSKRKNQESAKIISQPVIVTGPRRLPMIPRIYLFLEKEYEYMKALNGDNCDLSPLADILKRTSEATGVCEHNIITIFEDLELTDHLPERARIKRRKTIEHYSEYESEDDENLIENEEPIKTENDDIEVQTDTLGGTASESEPTTPQIRDIQIKLEPEDDLGTNSENTFYVEVAPVTPNSSSITTTTTEVQVKLEPVEDEVANSVNDLILEREQNPDCHNPDEMTNKIMHLESNLNDNTAPSNSAETTIKTEPNHVD